jgi:outer membrane protein OmpA-like peptidoglycan-associated protein
MKLFSIILSAAIIFTAVGCETAQPKADTKPAMQDQMDKAGPMDSLKAEFKSKVKPIPFAYKSSQLKLNDPKYSVAGQNLDSYMKKIVLPVLSQVINALPEGKKITVNGYASAKGPENAEKGKKGNIAISQERADAVLSYILKNSKISKDRFETRANGSSNTLPDVNPRSDKNCRVELDIE